MSTEEARKTHADLNARLLAARASLAANVARRANIAFAFEIGDGEARKEAAALVKAAPALEEDIRRLEAALAEAARRVASAAAAELDDAERVKAREALDMLDDFAKRGAALDARLTEFLAEYAALNDDFNKLSALGYAPTTSALVANNMQRATASKLMFTTLRQEFLAPGLRTTFVAAIEGWARVCRGKAEARLNRDKPARAA